MAFLSLLSVAGCGDDASSKESQNASLSKPQFVRQADALCQRAKSRFQAEYTRVLRENEATESEQRLATELVDVVIPIYSDLIDEIESLGAPAGDEQEISAFLDALQVRLDYADASPTQFVGSLHPFAEATKQAKAYGLNECAKSFG
jgi:hypothetical protein